MNYEAKVREILDNKIDTFGDYESNSRVSIVGKDEATASLLQLLQEARKQAKLEVKEPMIAVAEACRLARIDELETLKVYHPGNLCLCTWLKDDLNSRVAELKAKEK